MWLKRNLLSMCMRSRSRRVNFFYWNEATRYFRRCPQLEHQYFDARYGLIEKYLYAGSRGATRKVSLWCAKERNFRRINFFEREIRWARRDPFTKTRPLNLKAVAHKFLRRNLKKGDNWLSHFIRNVVQLHISLCDYPPSHAAEQ